jgi:hypothetical protein
LNGTRGYSINDAGFIAGYYSYNSPAYSSPNHGFVRTPSGFIAPVNAPGAGAAATQGTQAYGINNAGPITGQYVDVRGVTHGFVRSPDGSFTPVEAPGATEPGSGTFAVSINDAGDMTGYYFIGTGTRHSFVRRPSGTFREVDARAPAEPLTVAPSPTASTTQALSRDIMSTLIRRITASCGRHNRR